MRTRTIKCPLRSKTIHHLLAWCPRSRIAGRSKGETARAKSRATRSHRATAGRPTTPPVCLADMCFCIKALIPAFSQRLPASARRQRRITKTAPQGGLVKLRQVISAGAQLDSKLLLRQLGQIGESLRIVHGQIGQHLPIDVDLSQVQAIHEPAVG